MSDLDGRTPARRWRVLGTGLALLLAGCAVPDAVPSASESGPERGPLLEYMKTVFSVDAIAAEGAAYGADYQELIATCMTEAGFDYIPFIAPAFVVGPVADKGARDWVARRGYGLSGGAIQGPEAKAWEEAETAMPDYIDPNAALYAQLSSGTRAAYDLALNGPELTEDDDDGGVGEDRGGDGTAQAPRTWTRDDGCSMWALEEAELQRRVHVGDFTDLTDRMYAALSTVDDQPRMIDLTTEWTHCMADAGHTYASPTQAWDSLYAQIHGDPGTDGDPYATSTEIKALEIAVALADYDCKDALGWEDVSREVRDQIEAQFLADNKAEIDEYIAAVESTNE